MEHYITVEAGGNTKWRYIHNAALRKAKKLFARCRNPIEYLGIDHNKTVDISDNPVRCRFYCKFNICETQ